MIYLEPPDGFNPKFEVVSCFLEVSGEILLLHRRSEKPEGDTWGVPAGKVDHGEDRNRAMVRELFQETGHKTPPGSLKYFKKIFVRYPDYDFIYHIYHLPLSDRPRVKMNSEEHQAYQWVEPRSALEMETIRDLDDCIKLFYAV